MTGDKMSEADGKLPSWNESQIELARNLMSKMNPDSRVHKAQRDIAEILRTLEIETGHVVKRLEVVNDGTYQQEKDGTYRNGVKVRIGLFRVPGTFWSECAHG